MATDGTAWDVLRLLNWTKEYFSKSNLDSPRLCAEVLLAHVLGCRRIELYTRFAYQPAPAELERYRELVKRAVAHEPVAYLIGQKEFYSLSFKVTPDVLIPRSETEIVVSEAIAHLRGLGRAGSLWDVCTGSGCIAVAVAANVKDLRVLASDLSEAALAVAAQNVESHKLAERIRLRQADLLSLPQDCSDLQPFDAITANPPYVADGQSIAEEVKYEPAGALRAGPDGLACIAPIIRDASGLLGAGGILVLEFGAGQHDAVADLVRASGAYDEPRILKDHQGLPRTLAAVRKK